MDIYNIQGNVILSVPILRESEHVEELMRTDEVRLFWNSDSNATLPDGAYVIINNERYSLLEPYSPTQRSENAWRYEPVFVSKFYALSKVPFYMYTYEGGNVDGTIISREADWALTTNPNEFMGTLCRAIKNETGERYTYAYGQDLPASATVTFSSVDIISALNAIANAFKTEFWLEKYDSADASGNIGKIHLSIANDGETPKVLTVGGNINVPSITDGREGFYNRFVILGSNRNITQEYQGAGVNSIANKRLTLDPTEFPDGYIDFSGTRKPYTKILTFDEIYPSASDLVITNVRARVRYVLDDNGNRKTVPTPSGDVDDLYTIWYFQLKRKVGNTYVDFDFDDTTYDPDDNPDGMMLPGMKLSIHFNSGPLSGREFELTYHKEGGTTQDKADTLPFTWLAGDFEINYVTEGTYIIPAQTGLVPQDDNYVVLFNIRMPDDYVEDAQLRLRTAAFKEIGEKYLKLNGETPVVDSDGNLVRVDMNSYQFSSNPVAFGSSNPNLTIGAAVRYVNGGYTHDTRVTALMTKLDFPIKQTITIGNERVIGTIRELQEQATNANQNIDLLAALNESTKQITDAYTRTQQMILSGMADDFFEENQSLATLVQLKSAYSYIGTKKGLVFDTEADPTNSPAHLMVINKGTAQNPNLALYSPLPLITGGDQIVIDGDPQGGGGGGGATMLRQLEDVYHNSSSVLRKNGNSVANGDLLSYDSASNKWVALAQSTITPDLSNYYTKTQTDTQISSAITALNLGAAATYGVGSVASGNTGLVTGGSVYSAINEAVSSALKFQGITTTAISDGSTTNPITINNQSYTAKKGDVVLYDGKEYLWTGSAWEQLGDEASWALKTTTISAGTGLTGGGTLAANRTISLSQATQDSLALANTALQSHQTIYALTIKNSAGTTQLTYTPNSGTGSITLTKAMVGLGDVDNLAAADYFTALTSGSTDLLSITIGGTTKKLTTLYASRLTTVSKTIWGQTYWTANGVPQDVTAAPNLYIGTTKVQVSSAAQSVTGVINLTMSGELKIGTAKIWWDSEKSALRIDQPIITEGDQIVIDGTPGGGGGGGGATNLKELEDVYHNASGVRRYSSGNVGNTDLLGYDSTKGWYAVKLGTGLQMTNGELSATGTLSSVSLAAGATNGTLHLVVNGTAQSDVAVTGLKALAYKDSLAFSEITGTASDSQIPTLAISKISGLQTALDGKQPLDSDLTAIAAISTGTGLLKRSVSGSTVSWSIDTNTYLTGNQTITLSGDVTGSGTTAITTTIGAGKVTNAMLAGSIANAKLANSAITINGSSTSLGGSFSTASITAGTAGTSSATSGLSISVPYVTMNKYGIVTGYGTHTHTISKSDLTTSLESSNGYYVKKAGDTMTGDLAIQKSGGGVLYIQNTASNSDAGSIIFRSRYDSSYAQRNGFKISAEYATFADRLALVFYASNNGTSPYTPTWAEVMRITNEGYIRFTNTTWLRWMDNSETPTERSVLRLNADNQLSFGYGTATAGYNTYIHGNTIFFGTGASSTRSYILSLTTAGLVVPSTASIQIGEATITWNTNGYLHINKPLVTAGDQIVISGTPGGGGGGGATTLAGLDDVTITSVANGQLLQYNGTKWVNVAASSVGGVTSVAGRTGAITLTTSDITNIETWISDKGYITSYTDTKNTTGADNTTSKIFLVGPTAQTTSNGSARTYSNSNCYASGGYLYSGGSQVLTSHQTLYNLVINNSAGTAQITYKPGTSGTYALTLTKAMVGLGDVENTALSTWAGTTNITTLGTITSGTWSATTIAVNKGGTGLTTWTGAYRIIYSTAATTLTTLAPNSTTTRKFLRQVGANNAATAPAWDTVTKTDVGLSNVENTALSTWTGTSSITTLGTITTGVWHGTAIGNSYLANSSITINGSSTSLGGSFSTASITAGTAGQSTASSGLSISVPYVTMNAYGIVTGYGTHTHTISASDITTAIGNTTYAPYNANGYVSKAGDTMTGSLTLNDANANAVFVKNVALSGTTGWERSIVTLQVDGSNKFRIGAYGNYTSGGSSNGITYAYIGVNGYDGTNLRFGSDSTLKWGTNTVWHAGNSNLSTVPWSCSSLTASGLGTFDTITLTNTSAAAHVNFSRASWNYLNIPTGGALALSIGGAGSGNTVMLADANSLRPGVNSTYNLGSYAGPTSSSNRLWAGVYAEGVELTKAGGAELVIEGTGANANAGDIIFRGKSTSHSGIKLASEYVSGAVSDRQRFRIYVSQSDGDTDINWEQALEVNRYGNVTIGTTTNNKSLTVNGALTTTGAITSSGVLNITGATSYSQGIRIHDIDSVSSIWFRAVNASGYDAGMWGITAGDTGLRFRGPASTTATTPNDYVTIAHGGNVGIGVTPSYKLDVKGVVQIKGASSEYGLRIANSGNTIDGINGSNWGNLYINHSSTGNVYLCYGGGNVGIGTNSPSQKLHVAGSILSTGDQVVSSDLTLKTNLKDVTYSVSDIAKARAVEFDWKDGRGHSMGSIAQDWLGIAPALVHGEEGNMSLAYGQLALVNTILLARQSESHEERIKELEARVAELEMENERLRMN